MNIRWLLLIGLVSWAATCGQKGPLELPAGNSAAVPAAEMAGPGG